MPLCWASKLLHNRMIIQNCLLAILLPIFKSYMPKKPPIANLTNHWWERNKTHFSMSLVLSIQTSLLHNRRIIQNCLLMILLPISKSCIPEKPKAIKKLEHKEAKRRMLPINTTQPTSKMLPILEINHTSTPKENFLLLLENDGYEVLWSSCKCHNWTRPENRKSIEGSSFYPPYHAAWGWDNCGRPENCRSCSRNLSHEQQDYQDWDHKPAACNHKNQNHHVCECYWSKFTVCKQ